MATERRWSLPTRPDPGFDAGVLWAAAWLAREHGEDSLAAEMIHVAEVDITKADEYDRPVLERACRQ